MSKCSSANMEWTILFVFIAPTLACPSIEPTTIQIQNYDGPIFLHIPAQTDETCLHHYPTYQQTELECTCIAKPSIKYVPINTASESACYNKKNCGTCSDNIGGTCTCTTYNKEKHCGTCTCGNDNSSSNSGTSSYGNCDNGNHCRTCTCGTKNNGSCTSGSNNSGSCTCGTNDCRSNNSGSCVCGSKTCGSCASGTPNEGMQFYNERSYKGVDKICYTLDILKPLKYDSGYSNCVCQKCPCY